LTNARTDNAAHQRLRSWWQTPPRSGLQRLIIPWEYRHLRFFGITRTVAGSVAVILGLICLSYTADGWAAFFLVIAAPAFAVGGWYLTIAHSAPART
jgi:hypothetical protein